MASCQNFKSKMASCHQAPIHRTHLQLPFYAQKCVKVIPSGAFNTTCQKMLETLSYSRTSHLAEKKLGKALVLAKGSTNEPFIRQCQIMLFSKCSLDHKYVITGMLSKLCLGFQNADPLMIFLMYRTSLQVLSEPVYL